MPKRNIIVLLAFLTLTGITACCKKRVYCDSGNLNIAFVGFPRGEIRTILIKKYALDSFAKAQDSAFYIYSGNTPSVSGRRDTLWLNEYQSNNGMSNRITWGQNWQILVTSLERKYTFTNIGATGKRYQVVGCNDNSASCVNELSYFSLNDTYIEGNTIYIRK